MIRIRIHWPTTPTLPSFVQDMNEDLQASHYFFGTSYLSYVVLALALWLFLF